MVDIRMIQIVPRSTAFLSCLLLTACLLISDEEIAHRISKALPSGKTFSIVDTRKEISCIASAFIVAEENGDDMHNQNEPNTSASGLGEDWQSAASFCEYTNQISDLFHKQIVEATALHAKSCLKKIGISSSIYYDINIVVSTSKKGDEVLMLYSQNGVRRGIYLVQGR